MSAKLNKYTTIKYSDMPYSKNTPDSLMVTFEVKCIVEKDWHEKNFNPVFDEGDSDARVKGYFKKVFKKSIE